MLVYEFDVKMCAIKYTKCQLNWCCMTCTFILSMFQSQFKIFWINFNPVTDAQIVGNPIHHISGYIYIYIYCTLPSRTFEIIWHEYKLSNIRMKELLSLIKKYIHSEHTLEQCLTSRRAWGIQKMQLLLPFKNEQ